MGTRVWGALKGAQHKNTFGRGFAWYVVRIIVTAGITADCKRGVPLIDGISAQALLTNLGYDTDEIIANVTSIGCEVAIPPKINRTMHRHYDNHLYKYRHLIENAFFAPEKMAWHWTRYAKPLNAFDDLDKEYRAIAKYFDLTLV